MEASEHREESMLSGVVRQYCRLGDATFSFSISSTHLDAPLGSGISIYLQELGCKPHLETSLCVQNALPFTDFRLTAVDGWMNGAPFAAARQVQSKQVHLSEGSSVQGGGLLQTCCFAQ